MDRERVWTIAFLVGEEVHRTEVTAATCRQSDYSYVFISEDNACRLIVSTENMLWIRPKAEGAIP